MTVHRLGDPDENVIDVAGHPDTFIRVRVDTEPCVDVMVDENSVKVTVYQPDRLGQAGSQVYRYQRPGL